MSALSSLRQRGGEGGRTVKGHKSPPIQFVSIEAVFQGKLLVILWQDQYFEMPKATLQSTQRQDEIEQKC